MIKDGEEERFSCGEIMVRILRRRRYRLAVGFDAARGVARGKYAGND